jgi:hypothetical protein
MTYGNPDFPPTRLLKYPHMFALDIAIWERWLDLYSDDWDGFDYDVKVGSGTPPEPGLGSEYERMQAVLSKYRIDVIGYKLGSIHIIEVKPDAGTVALGQLETYIPLYKRDFKPSVPIFGAIVTDRELPDMKELMKMKGHELYIV